MKKFRFPYPIKPWTLNQAWGVYNPAYQRFGFTRHNGVDVALGADKYIRAPFQGQVIRTGDQPNGGGIFISILSDESYLFNDGKTAYVLADFLHCEKLLRTEGDPVILSQFLAIADNTGFSTGPHTHIQLRRCRVRPGGSYRVKGKDVHLEWIDQNHANNSFDPAPYYSKTYAVDETFVSITAFIESAMLFIRSLKGRR